MPTRKQKLQGQLKTAVKWLIGLAHGATRGNRGGKSARDVRSPERILLMNGAHIGDVVIATCVLPILRCAYPGVEIGMLIGSWSQMVVKNHPELTYTHTVDHWRLNRAPVSLYAKVRQSMRTRRTALRQLKQVQYDVSISMFDHYPDFLDIAWAAGIPVRIGFGKSLFSSLATDLVDYPESPFMHQGACEAELLRALPIGSSHFLSRRSSLPPSEDASVEEVCALLGVRRIEEARYRIIHMGSGEIKREFPVAFWREMAERLSPGCRLVFTGRGERESRNIAAAIEGLSNCLNACDRLGWGGFVAAIRHADVVYGVESMAGHVASAVGTKCVVVYGGMAGVAQWRPDGPDVVVFTNHVPCAPCHRPSGCEAMSCMQNITPSDLIRYGS